MQFLGIFLVLNFLNQEAQAIINGEIISESDYPAVVQIAVPQEKDLGCTATFVSENTLITASHCVISKNSKTKRYNNIAPKKILASAIYRRIGDDSTDIAFMIFDGPIAESKIRIYNKRPMPNQKIEFLGYGCSDLEWKSDIRGRIGRGVLRRGYSYLRDIVDNYSGLPGAMLFSSYDPAGICDGDSGGPLLIDGELAGVASSVGNLRNNHADLTSSYAISLLQQAVNMGAKIDGFSIQENRSDEYLLIEIPVNL